MLKSRINYYIDPQLDLIFGFSKGIVEYKDFNIHASEALNDVDFREGLHGLYDLRKVVRLIGNPEDFLHASNALTRPKLNENRNIRIAIVVGDNPLLDRSFDGWKVMMSMTQYHFETFPDIEYACHWLKEVVDFSVLESVVKLEKLAQSPR